MGCVESTRFVPNKNVPGQGKGALLVGFDLGYTLDDINKLYRAFCKMDPYGRGLVAKNVFATSFGFTSPDVARFIAKPFDTCDNNFIDFEEFMLACWNMLALRKEKLWMYAFNLLDVGGSKSLTREEAKLLISTLLPVNHEAIFLLLEKVINDSHIGMDDFSSLIEHFPQLLDPLVDIYFKLREATLGSARWDELVHARAMKFEEKTLKAIIREMKVKPSCITRIPVVNADGNIVDLPKRARPLRGSMDSVEMSSSRRKGRTARTSLGSNPSMRNLEAAGAAGGGGGRSGRKSSVVSMFTKSLSARLRLKLKIAQVQSVRNINRRVLSSTDEVEDVSHGENKADDSDFPMIGAGTGIGDKRRRMRTMTYDGVPRAAMMANQNTSLDVNIARAERRAKRSTIG